ncbi:MAG: hypothetical protein ETSY1_14815 [Candidatus Entotheonella factor]|uniref:CBS domain-containing protein n=2 Tax=Candidatus Entotheonella TaxID=93171 RepID=W4LP33_ENTF1|nr:MAG: hypothetical protein ETSY1_14815 [Candidatus Entotheonella factor]
MYVKDYMQAVIMTVSPNDMLSTARHIMDDLFIRHLPVLHEGRLVGLLSDRDIRQAAPANHGSHIAHASYDAFHGLHVSDVMNSAGLHGIPRDCLA